MNLEAWGYLICLMDKQSSAHTLYFTDTSPSQIANEAPCLWPVLRVSSCANSLIPSKAYLSFNIFPGGNTEDEFCSFFSPQTLQEFTVFEMFIVPWNLMDQLTDGLKQMIRMGEAQTDTQGHVIA